MSSRRVCRNRGPARDRRFASNPWIKERGLRFYAGVPLRAPGGQPIGSLCLLDIKHASEVMEEIAKRALQSTSADVPIAS